MKTLKQANVYYKDELAGVLKKTERGYVFQYDVGDHQKGPNINHGWSVVKTLKRMHFQKEQTNSPNRPNNKISQLT